MEACSSAHHWAREFAKFGHRHSHGAGVVGTQRCELDDDSHPSAQDSSSGHSQPFGCACSGLALNHQI